MGRRAYFWIRRRAAGLDRIMRFLGNGKILQRLPLLWGFVKIGVLHRVQPNRTKPIKVAGLHIAYNSIALLRDVYAEIFIDRFYAFETTSAKPRIIDAGANLGDSMLYYKFAAPEAEVICFEPDPFNCAIIHRNIALNGFQDVTVYESALSDREGTARLFFNRRNQGDTAQSLSEDFRAALHDDPDLDSREVRTESLRQYLTEGVDILKMDIEGAEGVVLRDIADLLPKVSCIQMEYHYSESTRLQDVLGIIEAAGHSYRVEPIQPIESRIGSVAMIYSHLPGGTTNPAPRL